MNSLLTTARDLLDSQLFQSILLVSVVIVIVIVSVRMTKRALRARITDNDLRYRASKLTGIAGYIVVAIVVITQLVDRFSGFTVAIGAASAGVAFALREVIASFAGWLAVVGGSFYKVGDRVLLGGIAGDVIDVGLLRTTIMECGDWVNGDLYNGRIVRIANSFVFKEPVFNYSAQFPFLWDEIVVPLRYGSDYELARRVLSEIASDVTREYTEAARQRWQDLVRSYRIEDACLEPLVTLVATGSSVEFTIRYIVAYRMRRAAKDVLFTRVLAAMDSSHGRLAITSMMVSVDLPKLRVSLEAPEDGSAGPKA